ncbi:unnamed protein product [Owenia fusiformis]|uniref:Uncharacterized protein n=1 Tax=Owenia fusiformis TaxID=6347 RepID=A0A8J1TMK8_OWEFU|nr:unnamed protein product [Owenia fusiformis]
MEKQPNRCHRIRSAISKTAIWKSKENRQLWRRTNRIVPFNDVENEEKVEEVTMVIELNAIHVYEWPEIDFSKFGRNGFYTKADCTMETILRMSPVYDPKFSQSQKEKDKRSLLERALHRMEKRAREAKYAVSAALTKKSEKLDNQDKGSQQNIKDDSGFSLF